MPVRKCLSAPAAGLLALALAACTQQADPEELLEPSAPVVEEASAEKNAPQTPRRVKGKKKSKGKKAAPAAQELVPAAAEPALPGAEAAAPAPQPAAPAFRPVEMDSPFVPSAPGKRIAHVSVPGPYVAVTFDDGPSAALTPQVLDIFQRHGARATFFVLGRNANRNRSILARAVAEGHEVGAHTWSHINMSTSSTATINKELDRTNAVIEEATGVRPKVMRPPYGAASKKLINQVYNRYGTPAILWDVDTNDWRKPGVQTVIDRAVGKAKPGSIILLHDIHSSTIEAVEGIVTGLQARGFKLVTVSELIAMGRRAAGASAPAREAEEPETPAAQPAAPVADAASSLHAQQQQQPAGEAGFSRYGAPTLMPAATLPSSAQPQQAAPAPLPASAQPLPASAPTLRPLPSVEEESDFKFYES